MRKLLPLLILIGWAASVSAQTLPVGPSPIITTNDTVMGVPATAASISFQVSGTFSGTLTFQASLDCGTYVSLLVTSTTTGATATTATAAGVWTASNGGYQCVRVIGTSMSSGRADINIRPGYAVARSTAGFFSNVVADNLCMSSTTKDSYFEEVGANNPGAYTGGTNCAGGTLRFDWNATRVNFAVPAYFANGTAAAPSLTFASDTGEGLYRAGSTDIRYTSGSTDITRWNGGDFTIRALGALAFGSSGVTSADVFIRRDAANTLALKNGTNLQTLRVYDASGAAYSALTGIGLTTGAGTTAAAPLVITNGTNLTSATANAVENDGVRKYWTQNTTNGRSVDDTWNYFQLTGDGTGITTIADFFGATGSGIPLVSGARYEIEWHCVFTQATAGTATWTIVTATTALANLEANYIGSNIAGLGTVGAPQMAGTGAVTGSSSTALPVTGTEATGVSHSFDVHAMITAGAGASNTRLRLTMSAGTATPKAGSYIKVRQLPAANTGTFVS